MNQKIKRKNNYGSSKIRYKFIFKDRYIPIKSQSKFNVNIFNTKKMVIHI